MLLWQLGGGGTVAAKRRGNILIAGGQSVSEKKDQPLSAEVLNSVTTYFES